MNLAILASIFATGFFFILFGGLNIIDPQNVGWLDGGFDPTLHYLSWEFFRQSPWSFPLGLNPYFGDEISASIVFSDSIPLLAILFKPFSNILPTTFQYLGIWTLVCYLLQAYFSCKLIGLVTKNWFFQFLGSILFVVSPIMLQRVAEHAALTAHFLVIGAIYLSFLPSIKYLYAKWSALLLVALLVNIYFLVPIFLMMAGRSIDLFRNHLVSGKIISAKIAAITVSIGVAAYLVGYFFIPPSGASGWEYGYRQLNILGPFDSQDWSTFIPAIPLSNPRFESFSYLGLGVILALVILCIRYPSEPKIFIGAVARRKYLFLSLVLLWCFAVSNRVAIGPYLFQIEIPDIIIGVASSLRASGRLFWPIYYLIFFGLIFLIARLFIPKQASLILFVILLVQIVDLLPGSIAKFKSISQNKSNHLITNLRDDFWTSAAKKYKSIKVIPLQRSVKDLPVGWHQIAIYAKNYGLKTNSVYMGRYDLEKIKKFNQEVDALILSGEYNQDTIYILSDEVLMPVLKNLRHKDRNSLFKIDGYLVLAPGWSSCTFCNPVEDSARLNKKYRQFSYELPLLFSKNSIGVDYLVGINNSEITGNGWAYPEDWGVWSEGNSAKITVPLIDPKLSLLSINIAGFIADRQTSQEVKIILDGIEQKNITLTNSNPVNVVIEIPCDAKVSNKCIRHRDYLTLEFKIKNPVSPKDLGVGDDMRKLGVGLRSISFFER